MTRPGHRASFFLAARRASGAAKAQTTGSRVSRSFGSNAPDAGKSPFLGYPYLCVAA